MFALFDFMTREFVSEGHARSLIQPFEQDLAKVWVDSHESWSSLPDEDRRRLGECATIPGINLFGYSQSYAREAFSGREDEGIVICDVIPQVFAFYINNEVLIRFNSLCRGHVVSLMSGSDLKRDYYHQKPIKGLINTATRLTVGYRLDASHTELAAIEVSLQVGDDRVYHFPIGGDSVTIALPDQETHPMPPSVSQGGRKNLPR